MPKPHQKKRTSEPVLVSAAVGRAGTAVRRGHTNGKGKMTLQEGAAWLRRAFRRSYPELTLEDLLHRAERLRLGGKPTHILDLWLLRWASLPRPASVPG